MNFKYNGNDLNEYSLMITPQTDKYNESNYPSESFCRLSELGFTDYSVPTATFIRYISDRNWGNEKAEFHSLDSSYIFKNNMFAASLRSTPTYYNGKNYFFEFPLDSGICDIDIEYDENQDKTIIHDFNMNTYSLASVKNILIDLQAEGGYGGSGVYYGITSDRNLTRGGGGGGGGFMSIAIDMSKVPYNKILIRYQYGAVYVCVYSSNNSYYLASGVSRGNNGTAGKYFENIDGGVYGTISYGGSGGDVWHQISNGFPSLKDCGSFCDILTISKGGSGGSSAKILLGADIYNYNGSVSEKEYATLYDLNLNKRYRESSTTPGVGSGGNSMFYTGSIDNTAAGYGGGQGGNYILDYNTTRESSERGKAYCQIFY